MSEDQEDPYETSDSAQDPTYTVTREDLSSSSTDEDGEDDILNINNIQEQNVEGRQMVEIQQSEEQPFIPNELWSEPVGNHMLFSYNGESGIKPEYVAAVVDASPLDFYSLFVDNEILDILVAETNLYATQELTLSEDIAPYSRMHGWSPTDRNEMKCFLGLLGYMGLVKMPTIRNYWCKKQIYENSFASGVMTRNRFELLLKMWHFSDNQACPEGNRIFKIEPLIDLFIEKCQEVYTPGSVVCIDETLIPFRGRLLMKQYIPNKTHKYGLKMFKLCCNNGFTWNMKLYSGKEKDATASVPTKVVMKLSEKLLNAGRTIVTDNYYTSLELANKLLDKQTHLLGTLRSNRRGNPKDVTNKKLKVGDFIVKENSRGICIGKWRDKRDVLFLSTKHGNETIQVTRRNGTVEKPAAIVDYNAGKFSIDISDQMASYNTALRKTIKWYRKIALEILLGTAVVNAHILYRNIKNSNITITEFREEIIMGLLHPVENLQEGSVITPTVSRKRAMNTHTFAKKEGPAAKTRKYCKGCYKQKITQKLDKNKVKKVTTYCKNCENEPHFCLECFTETHK